MQDIGKIDEAIIEYKSILTKNKNCENCYYNLGAIYLEIKKDNKKGYTIIFEDDFIVNSSNFKDDVKKAIDKVIQSEGKEVSLEGLIKLALKNC